ncbi:MAG TPA: hypothetical protein PLU30_20940 [Verrucomicrobiae bacterium]|nr:hypothetical protein [Verrucomicrobiae bacterium]
MQELAPETKRVLMEAAGYRELGMPLDSVAALALIPARDARHPAVLLAWCETEAARQDWTAARDRARQLTAAAPSFAAGWFWLGYALRRSESPAAAWRALRPVVGGFADEPVVDYNFACYACLDGHIEGAKASLDKLFASNPEWRECALRDEDLLAIRDWLKSK